MSNSQIFIFVLVITTLLYVNFIYAAIAFDGSSSGFDEEETKAPLPRKIRFSRKYDSVVRVATSNDSAGKKKLQYAYALAIVDVIGVIVIGILFYMYYKKHMRLKEDMRRFHMIQKNEENDEQIDDKGKRVADSEELPDKDKMQLTFMEGVASFELGDLLKASAEGLGKGNFGNSYRATLDDGRAVVVKRLRDLKPLTGDEFVKQIRGIAGLEHPNLLPLLAYYYSKHERFLVFKFAVNGNLYNRLHGGKGTRNRIPFSWSSRLAVARAVAKSLEYLHLNFHIPVPHANLKSSNILLDEKDEVLLADYGLTSIVAPPIAVQRMVSFKSPEFQTSKRVSKKSDIWCFGGLLLELLTGRVCVHSAPPEANGIDLCNWVHRAVREEWTAEIFDPEVSSRRGAYNGMLGVLQMAIRCCDKLPDKRPSISELVRELENVKSVIIDSEDDEDFSNRSSYTDESLSEKSIIIGDDRNY
ncbi:putative inactive receptor kinase At2g26730 [Apium graveolens]|uniref:putative inactive receptor kinase At2g26730 n=1 Tax=Apium graveolens TaxID=4045 RepID=UPI003D7BE4A3